MSSSYREACNVAKAARAGIIEQRPQPNRNKKAKPVVVEYRLSPAAKTWSGNFWASLDDGWRKWNAYRTIAEAEKVISDQHRKSDLWELRIKAL